MIFNIDAQVILSDTIDLSPFVISYTRTQSMCNTSHTGDIKLSPNVLQFLDLNEIDIQVYEPIKIIEYGKTVLTGYVSRISKSRTPATTVSLYVSDKYKRAKDYFIEDPERQTNGETIGALFTELCDLCGLSSSVDDSAVGNTVLPPGEKIGLSSVDGVFTNIVAYGSGVIYTDGNGVVHLRHGARSSNIQFTTGQTTPVDATTPLDLTHGNVFAGTYVESDENARDVVSVWGYGRPNPYSSVPTDLRIVASRSVDLGLPVHKTAVYSSSLIQTQAEAERLASVMIQELGKLEQTVTVECQGHPDIAIVKKAAVSINLETTTVTATKKITTVVASVSEGGYVMNVTMDEFCPKFAGWSVASLPLILYAGTTRHGVYKSVDGGHTWFAYNNGLPNGLKYVSSIATTDEDEVMALINGGIWYTTTSGFTNESYFWTRKFPNATIAGLTEPYSSSGRYVNVMSDGQAPGGFNVMMRAARQRALVSGAVVDTRPECRTWVYHTENAGTSWSGTLIHNGTDKSYFGLDMSSRLSTPYIVTTKGAEDFPTPFPVRIQKGPLTRYAYRGTYMTPPLSNPNWYYTEIDPEELGVIDFHPYTPTILAPIYHGPYYGVITGGLAYKRSVGIPLYLIMNIPEVPGIRLISVQVYWQFSDYYNPFFSLQNEYNMVTAHGEWSYQNWLDLLGVGNIGQRPFTAYDEPGVGNFAISDYTLTVPTAYEWNYDKYRLWGDGTRGSMGLCFLATYTDDDTDPAHPDFIQVGTGVLPIPASQLAHGASLTTETCFSFSAGTMFWEFE